MAEVAHMAESRGRDQGEPVRLWVRFLTLDTTDDGASLVEYALLLVLIAVVSILVITQIGGSASEAIGKTDAGFKK